ncbi:Hypothetical_protein [Hexamita inflata]|uniref:Hypothetical_protein n=1 Tax=Hexamita inflata TaxID=28002 RepID=A0ABP1HPQ0_9EUKA
MIQNRDMAFQDPTKVNKETRDFFSKNRHEFINSKQYPINVKSEVKLGHCMDNYYQITNKGFQFLVDMRFNKKQKYKAQIQNVIFATARMTSTTSLIVKSFKEITSQHMITLLDSWPIK